MGDEPCRLPALGFRATASVVLAVVCLLIAPQERLRAAEKTFTVSGATVSLQEVSAEVPVRFRSMRFNRALNVWNVEALLTNAGPRTLLGPWVLLIEDFQNTSGPQGADGLDDSVPAKAFYDFTTLVPNNRLGAGESSGARTLTLGMGVGVPSLVTKVYAGGEASALTLALTRTLDAAGQPLPDVRVEETGPNGPASHSTDPAFGVVTLGQGSGQHVWKFSAPGYLPVWRQQNLSLDVAVLANPRLVLQDTNSATISPVSGGELRSGSGSLLVSFPPGATTQELVATLTPLTAQTLPAFLPLGWSPLQAFWIETRPAWGAPASASIVPWGPLAVGETVALARWNELALNWQVVRLLAGNGTNAVIANVEAGGAYVLAVGDAAPYGPPSPQVGQALLPGSIALPNPSDLSAMASVNPPSSPANRRPELVTATAELLITNRNGAIPSGLILRCETTEDYRLNDGTRRRPPQYESFITGYQRPGDAVSSTLHARFPLRPLLLFGAEELIEATVKVEVLVPTPFSGGVLDSTGGTVAAGEVRILAGANDIVGRQAAQLRELDPGHFADFATNGITVVRAFELSVAGVAPGRWLVAQFTSVPTNGYFVLARVLYDRGQYGLLPVERLVSDAVGRLSSAEPAAGVRLPGATGSGQYLVLQVPGPLGLLSGVARDAASQPAAGLPVRVIGQPWLAFSGTAGAFRLAAPTGHVAVAVMDLATGDGGSVEVNVPDPQAMTTANVGVVAAGPRVVAVSPDPGAKGISRVAPVVVTFSKPVNPAALLGGGLQLLGGDGQPVGASLSLNLPNTAATLLPNSPLAAGALHTITLSTNISDATGQPLEGATAFTFTTEAAALDRSLAQLTSYEPDGNGMAGLVGGPGTAEPEAPVILVNETTGYTATVLSKPDGSFTNSIPADVDDELSAVVVNANGTRNIIPASRQIFRDGSVGLFNGGGLIEAEGENGPIQVVLEPGSIPQKTVIRVTPVGSTELASTLGSTPPEEGKVLGGFKYFQKGDPLTQPPRISFPVKVEDLGLPPGTDPTNAVYALTIPHEIQDDLEGTKVMVYEIVDRMLYEEGTLVTHTPPYLGLLPFASTMMFGDILLTPVAFSVGWHMTIGGRVLAAEFDAAGVPDITNARRLSGAVVRVFPDGVRAARPGRIQTGAYVTTAHGPNAYYSLLLPAATYLEEGTAVALVATHPAFPGKFAMKATQIPSFEERFAIGNILSPVDLIFPVVAGASGPDQTAPNLTISHNPFYPPPTGPTEVRVVSTDDTSVPTIDLMADSVTSLVPDVPVVLPDVTINLTSSATIGTTGRRSIYEVVCQKPARVVVKATATDDAGNQRSSLYAISFGGADPGGVDTIPMADPEDRTGPMVISAVPPRGGSALAPGEPVVLRFNEPIQKSVLQDPFLINVSPVTPWPTPQLSDDQQQLTLYYPALAPDTLYTITVTPGIQDLKGNPLDQDPTTSGDDSFELSFRTAPLPGGDFSGIEMGGGAVMKGIYAYVLERAGAANGELVVYDLSDPTAPVRHARLGLPGYPRSLTLIPHYSFLRRPGASVETKDLIAVVGGRLGMDLFGQYLWVIDISNPASPQRVASAVVTVSTITAVTKVQWSAPTIAYLETGEVPAVNTVNLQSFIYGLNLSRTEFNALPLTGRPGLDANQDGDYVDPGDILPLPARSSPDFAGKEYSFTLGDTDQLVRDFCIAQGGAYLGVVVEGGFVLDEQGRQTSELAPAAYRTLVSGTLDLSRTNASYLFSDVRPTRVTTLLSTPLQIAGQLQVLDLALVSCASANDNSNRVAVLDITDRTDPRLLSEILIPPVNGRPPYSIFERDDGLLMLATLKDILLLDPAKLAQTNASGGSGLHPAIVGVVPGAGTGTTSFGGAANGLYVFSQGGRNRVVQTAPALDFVRLPETAPFDPAALVTTRPGDEELADTLRALEFAPYLQPARFRGVTNVVESALDPPSPTSHYYVLVKAPGSAGPVIDLALESLNWTGTPLRKRGFLFPPVHALSASTLEKLGQTPKPSDAPVSAAPAYRLSNNPGSAYYNVYLSCPLALVYEEMSKPDLARLDADLPREVLWSGDSLRASLDPATATNSVVGRFAGEVNASTRRIDPGAMTLAFSFPADYLQGPNPHPVTGGANVVDALGMLGAHNAELIHQTVDLVLPGRRLPLEFQRTFAGQGLYEGPFGRGWDFNFNQRIIECREQVFPEGLRKPLVVRDTLTNSEVAFSRDLQFYNGAGRVTVYQYAGTNPPPGQIRDDPLFARLGWADKVARYYLPPPGLFSFMVKFHDGRFARLEPDGRQYWFNGAGRLIKLYDRYEKNALELIYNAKGELAQIKDELGREIDIGYWRLPSDNDPPQRPAIDRTTSNPLIAGKICRLKDYSGRDILFFYTDQGLLERREGPQVTVAMSPRGFLGRQRTYYAYSGTGDPARTAQSLIAVTSGDPAGTPFVSVTQHGAQGRDTVQELRLAGAPVTAALGYDNTARALSAGNQVATITTPDGSTSEYTFDQVGHIRKIRLSGVLAESEETATTYFPNGLVQSITHPEGNSTEFTYDSGSPHLRSRGNILRIRKLPGPRGGDDLEATTAYDNRYNLPAGQNRDYNGESAQITLFPDGRDTQSVTKGNETESYAVNEFGQITRHTAYDGVIRTWTFYPATGFLRSQGVGDLETTFLYLSGFSQRGLPSASIDPQGVTTTFVYDERNQLVESSRAGVDTRFAYDESGNCIVVDAAMDSGRRLVEDRYYNQVGFLTRQVVRDVEVDGSPRDLEAVFEPDEAHRIRAATFNGTDRHELTYDHLGRVVRYQVPGAGYDERRTYDRNGNHRSTTIGAGTEEYVYDGHDRLIQTVTPRETRVDLTPDGNNNLRKKKITDREGAVLFECDYEVDALNRYTRVTRYRDSGPPVTVKYDYAAADRSITFTDGKAAQHKTYYDTAGRVYREELPTKTIDLDYYPNGNLRTKTSTESGRAFTESFTYDVRDHLESVTDSAGQSTRFVCGLDGRVLELTDRENHVRHNAYTLLGELASATDPNHVVIGQGYDANRRLSFIRDTVDNRTDNDYDPSGRLTESVLPDAARTTDSDFDPLNLPQTIAFPRGIDMALSYNPDGTPDSRHVSGIGAPRQETYRHDGLRRLVYLSDPSGVMERVYDKFGFIKEFKWTHSSVGLSYSVLQDADDGGFRSKVVYPTDHLEVSNGRDLTGRLISLVSGLGEPVVQNTAYATDRLIEERSLGAARVTLHVEYDNLKRAIARRYARSSDGQTLVDVRYAYDKNGAQLARQFLHRAGRADFFRYDPGYRLTRADIGARPKFTAGDSGRELEGFAPPPVVPGEWMPGLYARKFDFSTVDALTLATLLDPDGLPTPPFATNYASPDSLVHSGSIDGFTRPRDEIGNVLRVQLAVRLPGESRPVPVGADLTYNDLGQLVLVSRDDGVQVRNEYNALGLRIRRTVTGDPGLCYPSDLAYVYDGANLIEERDVTAGNGLLARYYYGDEGDELIAGDLRPTTTAPLARYYFLTDASQSVLAVADATGTALERVIYDAWGEPTLQLRDEAAPTVSEVLLQTNDLLITFSESVLPAFDGSVPATNLFGQFVAPAGIFEFRVGGSPVSGTVTYEENLAGVPFGSTFRFRPQTTLTGTVELTVFGGKVQDEWSNVNAPQTLTLNVSVPRGSILFSGPPAGTTAPVEVVRSSVGSPFLFHGQVFDCDTGLLYCRARFYQPSVGLFLQRDPEGYLAGVNHYAAFANNPVNFRDPTGTLPALDEVGAELCLIGSQASYKEDGVGGGLTGAALCFAGRVLQLGTATAEGMELLQTQSPGTLGLLDVARGTELIKGDVEIASMAFGVGTAGARLAVNGAAGAAQRVSGFFNKARHSPMSPYEVRKMFRKQGFTAMEADSIIEAMADTGVSAVSIRTFGKKAVARQRNVSLGMQQKPMHIKEHTGADATLRFRGQDYTSDMDLLHIEINGRNASPLETERVFKRANEIYERKWIAAGKASPRIDGGICRPPNPPFQHGAQLDLAWEWGKRVGNDLIDNNYISKVGHPGDCITVRRDGSGNILARDTPRWWINDKITEYGHILANRQFAAGQDSMGWPRAIGNARDWDQWWYYRFSPQRAFGTPP